MRDGETPDGMRCISSDGDGGTVFGFDGWAPEDAVGTDWRGNRKPTPASKPSKADKPPRIDAEALHAAAVERLTPERLAALVDALGVPAEAVRTLCPGWCDAEHLRAMGAGGAGWSENYPDGAWSFPERDGAGRIVGFSLRAPDGRKGSPSRERTGLRRALTLPFGTDLSGPLVLVVEGASDAAAGMAMLGFRVVGRPSNKAGADDLADLLRHVGSVVVLGENDAKPDGKWPGRDGAESVARTLAERWGRPVRWCMPPDGAKDLRELYAAHGAEGGAMLREHIEREAETIEPPTRPDALSYEPFPVDALPEPMRAFALSIAASVGVPVSLPAAALLVSAAAMAGTTRGVRLSQSWVEFPVLWAAVVALPSFKKTPATIPAMAAIESRERQYTREHAERMQEWNRWAPAREETLAAWRKEAKKSGVDEAGPPPELEPEPERARCVVKNATIEAMHRILGANPRGVLWYADELAGIVRGFNAYKSKGGDTEEALSWWRPQLQSSDRVSGSNSTPFAAVSLFGTIQPGQMPRVFGGENTDNGLLSRLLLVWLEGDGPPPNHDDPPIIGGEAWASVIDRLAALQFAEDAEGELAPVILTIDAEARRVWTAWLDEVYARKCAAPVVVKGAISKLEGYAARLSLTVHLARVAARDSDALPDRVDGVSMRAGVLLARWFCRQAEIAHSRMNETDKARANRELAALVERNGGTMTPRRLCQLSRAYATTAEAAEALRALAAAGWGVFNEAPAPGPQGGRPKSGEFVLHPERKPPAEDAAPEVSETGPADDSEADAGDDDGWRDVGAA